MPRITSTAAIPASVRTRGRRKVAAVVITKRKPKYGVRKGTAKAIRNVVKSVIRKEAETKFVSVRQDQSFNSAVSGASECYAVMPAITQGTDDYQRIGDKVRGRYLYIKGHLQYNASYLNTALATNYVPPSTVRLMVLSQKNIKSSGQLSSVDVSHLLKDNVATGAGRAYVGAMTDNLAPINKDLFRVHMDKKIKMDALSIMSDNTGTAAWTGMKAYYFSCRIKLPATLYFDDGNGNNPNNFAPFFCLGSVLEDGTTPWSVGTPYRITFLSTAYFEDA